MKRLTLTILILLFFVSAGPTLAWEARMAAMGNPYGLVNDQSDFLTHPSMIADGSGVQFFIHYDYMYTDVSDWDTGLDFLGGPTLMEANYDISGDRDRHEVRAGTAFPVGAARMGIFFSYKDEDDDYDGEFTSINMLPDDVDQRMHSDIQDYTVSLFFGIPLNSLSLGAEAGIAHTSEENSTIQELPGIGTATNQIAGALFPAGLAGFPSLHHYMIPYDSAYWEGFLKTAVSGGQGPVRVAFTARGGLIFSGDNDLEYKVDPVVDMNVDGDVDGWSAGAELWLRFIAGGGFSLPFLARADYKRKERDGKGIYESLTTDVDTKYSNKEETLELEAGGGIEKVIGSGSRVAAGVYYQFIKSETDLYFVLMPDGADDVYLDHDEYPESDEHRLALKIAGEINFSQSFSLLLGAGGFYGWVDYDLLSEIYNSSTTNYDEKMSADGTRWGACASLGGSIKAGGITIEPFITGAYSELHLDGEGPILYGPGLTEVAVEFENERDDFMVGGGVSVLFN